MKNDPAYLLVLDALRVPEAKQICGQESIEYSLLYSNTDWAAQLANSPICIKLSLHDAVHLKWVTEKVWASSGVIFEYENQVERERALGILPRNITIMGEDDRMLFLRFYSPKTLIDLAEHAEQDPIDYLLGNATTIHISPLYWDSCGFERINKTASNRFVEQCLFPTSLIEALMQ